MRQLVILGLGYGILVGCPIEAVGQSGAMAEVGEFPAPNRSTASALEVELPRYTSPDRMPGFESLDTDAQKFLKRNWPKISSGPIASGLDLTPWAAGGFRDPIWEPGGSFFSGPMKLGYEWSGGYSDPSGGFLDPKKLFQSLERTNRWNFNLGMSNTTGRAVVKPDVNSDATAARPVLELPEEISALMIEDAKAKNQYATNYLAHLNARLDYESKILSINLDTLTWTRTESRVGFWVAHACLLLGVVLAAIEYGNATRLRRMGRKANNPDIEISAEKIAFKNVSVAIVLVILSVALYLAYLKFVFPIQTV